MATVYNRVPVKATNGQNLALSILLPFTPDQAAQINSEILEKVREIAGTHGYKKAYRGVLTAFKRKLDTEATVEAATAALLREENSNNGENWKKLKGDNFIDGFLPQALRQVGPAIKFRLLIASMLANPALSFAIEAHAAQLGGGGGAREAPRPGDAPQIVVARPPEFAGWNRQLQIVWLAQHEGYVPNAEDRAVLLDRSLLTNQPSVALKINGDMETGDFQNYLGSYKTMSERHADGTFDHLVSRGHIPAAVGPLFDASYMNTQSMTVLTDNAKTKHQQQQEFEQTSITTFNAVSDGFSVCFLGRGFIVVDVAFSLATSVNNRCKTMQQRFEKDLGVSTNVAIFMAQTLNAALCLLNETLINNKAMNIEKFFDMGRKAAGFFTADLVLGLMEKLGTKSGDLRQFFVVCTALAGIAKLHKMIYLDGEDNLEHDFERLAINAMRVISGRKNADAEDKLYSSNLALFNNQGSATALRGNPTDFAFISKARGSAGALRQIDFCSSREEAAEIKTLSTSVVKTGGSALNPASFVPKSKTTSAAVTSSNGAAHSSGQRRSRIDEDEDGDEKDAGSVPPSNDAKAAKATKRLASAHGLDLTPYQHFWTGRDALCALHGPYTSDGHKTAGCQQLLKFPSGTRAQLFAKIKELASKKKLPSAGLNLTRSSINRVRRALKKNNQ